MLNMKKMIWTSRNSIFSVTKQLRYFFFLPPSVDLIDFRVTTFWARHRRGEPQPAADCHFPSF